MAASNSYTSSPPPGIKDDSKAKQVYISPEILINSEPAKDISLALVDDNSVVRLPQYIHSEMQYSRLVRNIDPNLDYVLIEAKTGEERIHSVTLPITDSVFTYNNINVTVNMLELIRDRLGLGNGSYDIHFCVYRNYIYNYNEDTGNYKTGKITVEEISPSRNEIRIKPELPQFFDAITEWSKESPIQPDHDHEVIWPAVLKNIQSEIDLVSINWQNIEFESTEDFQEHIIFKLVEPLPNTVSVGNSFLLTRDIISPYTVSVLVDLQTPFTIEFNELRGPNFKAINIGDRPNRSTPFKSWDSLLSTDTSTNNSIINKFISSSDNISTNIDFRKYNNFVHFSSAEERLKNFKYKLELIEFYNSQSSNITTGLHGKPQSGATGSFEFLQNKAMYSTKRDNIVSGFDDYEKFLYFESHSSEVTSYDSFPAATWPKHTHTKPFSLIHTTGSEAIAWYNLQLESASLYDTTNQNILRNTVPQHIIQDPNSDSYVLFIDMLGQHFDNVYNLITNITKRNDHEESVYEGLSKDLIYDVAKSFGWSLQSGFDSSKLWEYVLGTDETGSYDTATNQVREESYSHEDIEKQTWKRILNNLPYLLKTKGTARGIKALLNTYGIPNTMLQIQEYGGSNLNAAVDTRREIEKFSYGLDFSGSRHIQIAHNLIDSDKTGTTFSENSLNRYPSMYEFRFDITEKRDMHLVSTDETSSITGGGAGSGVSRFEVILEHSSSASPTSSYYDYGRLVFKLNSGSHAHTTMTTSYAPFYDNDWWNVSFGVQDYVTGPSDTGQETFEIRYAKIGEHADAITHNGSATFTPGNSTEAKRFNGAWGNAQNILVGGTGSGYSNATYLPFSGSIQEVRGWAEYIYDPAFHQHTLSPTSILGNNIEMGFNDLLFRYPLGTDNRKYNHSLKNLLQTTESIPNPNNRLPFSSGNTDAQFIGWPSTDSVYNNKSETYYVSVPNTVGPRAHDNKVRIEDNRLKQDQLSWDKSFEISSFDSNPLDTDQVDIALSPQDQIEIDISMQFGGFKLDDYVGDPRDKFSKEYKSLKTLKDLYFKKYDDRYNIWAFIRLMNFINKGFFNQIESLLPARADATVGILIRPTFLERVKLDTAASMSFNASDYSCSMTHQPNLTGHGVSQSFDSSDYLILTETINTGERASNPGYNSYRDGSLYQYGDYTGSGLQEFVTKYGDANKYSGPYVQSLTGSNPQHIYSTGLRNLIINGSKLKSLNFNEASADTLDGAPAVEFSLTNPNRLKTVEATPTKTPFKKKSDKQGGKGKSISEIIVR